MSRQTPPSIGRYGALLALVGLLGCQGEAPSRGALERPAPQRASAAVRQDAPASAVDPYVPIRTRDGRLRIVSQALEQDPGAAAELLRRLDAGGSSELRMALVDALPRTRGPWQDQALARMAAEPDAAVRKMWVATMTRAESDVAVRGMALGLGDDDPSVRAEAALVAGSLQAAALREGGFEMLLRDRLEDSAAEVRAGAARSLGILGFADMFDDVSALLADSDANVRLQALRSLGRIDRPAARALPAVAALRDDPDAKVARAAARLLQ